MNKNIERIPAVFRHFLHYRKDFAAFLGFDYSSKEYYHARKMFLDRYENLLAFHLMHPDLRFAQLMYNEGVIQRDANYFLDEAQWLLKNTDIDPGSIITWKSYPLDWEKRCEEWLDSKPKHKKEYSVKDRMVYGFQFDDDEIYATKYGEWMKRKPTPNYNVLNNLQTSHLKNILLTQSIPESMRQVIQNIINARESKCVGDSNGTGGGTTKDSHESVVPSVRPESGSLIPHIIRRCLRLS